MFIIFRFLSYPLVIISISVFKSKHLACRQRLGVNKIYCFSDVIILSDFFGYKILVFKRRQRLINRRSAGIAPKL